MKVVEVWRVRNLPIVVRGNVFTTTFVQTRLMSATIIEILVAQNSSPVSMANALKGGNTISVKTTYRTERQPSIITWAEWLSVRCSHHIAPHRILLTPTLAKSLDLLIQLFDTFVSSWEVYCRKCVWTNNSLLVWWWRVSSHLNRKVCNQLWTGHCQTKPIIHHLCRVWQYWNTSMWTLIWFSQKILFKLVKVLFCAN